ncbi:MAG: trans-acting enoyl reductase family protein [Planctomycetota bacterium]
MLYGANGYTGRLIAAQALAEGTEPPILAGRREEPLRALAAELGGGLEVRAFPLGGEGELARRAADALAGVDAVLHCAGPFSATSQPMVEACLAAGAHYLDITGEIAVFEAVLGQGARAERAGVALLPGVGFDVVPSDCLAAMLARRLPEARSLELAFAPQGGGGTSQGTTKTMVEGLGQGGCVRRGGRLVKTSTAHATRVVDFACGRRLCVAIPWGDVSTAFHSTGIPDITVYMAQPYRAVAAMRLLGVAGPLLRGPRVQRALKGWVERNVAGPSEEQRERGRVHLWGRVEDRWGVALEGTLVVREGYRFTADAALACLERVRAGAVAPGAWTPSRAFGADFVTTLPEVELHLPDAPRPGPAPRA